MKKYYHPFILFFLVTVSTDVSSAGMVILPEKQLGPFLLDDMVKEEVVSSKVLQGPLKGELFFSFDPSGKLIEATTTSPDFETESKLKVGSTRQRVETVFGEPRTDRLIDPKQLRLLESNIYDGIIFMFDKDVVYAVTVFSHDGFDFIPTKSYEELTGYQRSFNEMVAKLELTDELKALEQECFKDYAKIHPSYKIKFLNAYHSKDGNYYFFEFTGKNVDDLKFYYVFSKIKARFIGRFYIPQA